MEPIKLPPPTPAQLKILKLLLNEKGLSGKEYEPATFKEAEQLLGKLIRQDRDNANAV